MNRLYILNSDNSINWEKYKIYTEHYHNLLRPLSEPYNEEELGKICIEKQIELPSSLFAYLTKVSNKVYIESGYLSTDTFDLSDLPSKEDRDKVCIPLDKTDITKIEDYNNYEKVFIKISDLGCGHSFRMYLGSGEHYGSIWYNECSDFEEHYGSIWYNECSDFEGLVKRNKSFEEYIIKNFDERFMHNDDVEDETNYVVDSATTKYNEDTRKMTIEVIDKVFAEYYEKHKEDILICKIEDFEWKPCSEGDDW